MNSSPIRGTLPRALCLALAFFAAGNLPPIPRAAGGEAEAPAPESFVVIPLRVHVLRADDLPEVDCKLSDADVGRVVGKVNGIWHKAGVHFGLESVVREPAEGLAEFRAARGEGAAPAAPLGAFAVLRPQGSRRLDGLHVYYVHRLPVNGVYMGRDFAFVQETAALRPVEGGIDEPIPRVTAHELGHALGLPHRQDRTNLMASGTTGTLLNAEEVAAARGRAGRVKGAGSPAEWLKAADAAAENGEQARARQIRGWLASIPEGGATDARPARQGVAPATKPAGGG